MGPNFLDGEPSKTRDTCIMYKQTGIQYTNSKLKCGSGLRFELENTNVHFLFSAIKIKLAPTMHKL